MKVYTLYLSTTATYVNKPTNKSNLAQVRWNINWREIFDGRQGFCRVRCKLLSASSNALTWAANTGSVRATFQSVSTSASNGFNLGYVRPQSDYTSGAANTTYLDLDTLTSNGATIAIPNSNNDFVISLLNSTESQMVSVPEYQIWFYFEVDEDDSDSDSEVEHPPHYLRPR